MNTEAHYWIDRDGRYFARVQTAEGTVVFGPANNLAALHLTEADGLGISMAEHLETMLKRTRP